MGHNESVLRPTRPRTAHVVAALALVAYWALLTLGSQFAVDVPGGVLHDLWYSAVPFVLGWFAALGVGLYIARWWLLLAALTPVVVLGVLELVLLPTHLRDG